MVSQHAMAVKAFITNYVHSLKKRKVVTVDERLQMCVSCPSSAHAVL